jgi:hypothetical protein
MILELLKNFFVAKEHVILGTPLSFAGIHALAMIVAFFILVWYLFLSEQNGEQDATADKKYEEHFNRIRKQAEKRNARWDKITELIRSQNQADWVLAIIEADTMLDSMLTSLGYPGESIGEKLTRTNTMQFPALEFAWQAHKIRNKIAHEGIMGVDYREALHAYRCFEKVFQDARFI